MTSGAPGPRRALLPDQSGSGGSSHTLTTSRQPSHTLDPLPSKRICFYKSGDPQFGGLRMVINRRTFKSFEALLDSLSTKVPLPFGVRNITTPRGVHAVHTLEQLEDGKSYICSDSRKVKPINLALARKKLPPWYNARPGTGRRKAAQVAKMYPGGGKHRHAGQVVVRTPRRLMVFRNGEPAVYQTVMLKKKSTQSFEVLLQYLSELMQFPVVKLHSVDGRRVDGLPALILCSGTVVAAGKEPFKSGNYDMQRSPAPNWLPTNRMGPRKIRPSESSQVFKNVTRYFLNQIHNSISESVCDGPSNPTESIELENSHMLQSVFGMDAEPCPDHGTHEQGSCLPTEDDIEKSFRVNEDGSMTVEMKVRLTLKEEETIHWTTTLTRSTVANQLLPDCFPEPEPEAGSELEQESGSPEPDRPGPSHPAVPSETTSSHEPKGDDDDNNEPLPHDSGVSREEGNMEDEVTGKTSNVMSTWRAPTPGVRKAQTSTESVRANTAETVQEGTVRSYSYRAETEQYRMVQQSSTRPVPKPRRLASMDVNYRYDQAEFNSVGMSEVLQIENNREEVTETVLHVYEQQTCHENLYANTHYHAQGVSMYGASYGRPSTSDTTWSTNANVEHQFGRPSTASESIHSMRADSMLISSDINPCKSLVINTPKKEFTASKDYSQLSRKSGKGKLHQSVADKANKTSSNTKAVKKHVRWIKSPGNRRQLSPKEASKKGIKVKPFSSIGFLKKIYGGRPRPMKTTMRRKKTATEKEKARPATESSDPPDVTMKCTVKDPYTLSSGDDKKQETIPLESNMLERSSKTRTTLTHQQSIHEERQTYKASSEVNRTMPLPVLNSSSSEINEYVAHWLENSPSQHALCPSDQTQAVKMINQVGLEGGIPEESEINCLNNCSEDKTEKIDTKRTPKNTSVPSNAILNTLSSTSSRTLADRPLTVSTTADQAASPSDHPKTTSTSSLSAGHEEPLSRNSSVKRARLVSNLSFERKMSQRKASVEKSALTKQITSSSIPTQTADELTNQPNLEHVLEKICFSIKSIRQITQKNRPSCLEKSNSLPDFSGHVATTFGSSSKALLAFLAVMTLKEVLTQEHKCELDALNASCAEALKLIDSLREIASIEDSDQLKTSLSELQMSASTQLLQSWKGFQELSKSRRSPNQSKEELRSRRNSLEYSGAEEGAIDELMEELHIPETLKEELATFPACTPTARDDSGSVEANTTEKPSNDNVITNSEEDTVNGSDCVQTDKANVDGEALVDVSIEDNKVEDSRNNGKKQKVEEKEVEQGSLNENQSIKSYVPYMDLEETTEERNEENRCSSEGEHLDRESKELDRNSEDSMFSPEEVSSADEKQKHILSTEGRHRNVCNPKTQQKLSSTEEQRDVEFRQLKQVRNNNMSDYKSLSSSEKEEHKLQRTNRFKRLSVTISSTHETSSQDVEDRTSSEDDQHVDVEQLGRTNNQIRRKLTRIESLSERSEENVSTPDAEELRSASIRILADKASLNVESSTPDTKMTQALPGFRSAPQSSLSFSYDSSGIINRQSEGAMVRSIKEMFMAKRVPDVQCEDGEVHEPISSEPSPASQSQDPDELSEAASIAKGFVRRTIERLYGRKDPTSADTPSKRPTSSPKQKKESFSILSSLHSARSKQQSDMPYFNSTNTLDTLSGATHCMAFNTQVGPDNSLLIDQDRSLNHKSYLDQVEINKAVETPLPDKDLSEDTKQKVPISLFSTNSEPDDKLALTKCTYFSLPCTSDSELGPDDPDAISKNIESSVDIKEDQEEAKSWVGNNSTLPGLRLHDNKVHPLTQGAPGGQVVVVQPGRGQSVTQRPVELDVLDALYTFCGQHCPIL
ncbi:unnamed protein product [Lota lota]